MLQAKSILALRGYVIVEFRGNNAEALINAMAEKRMNIWELRRQQNGVIRCSITIVDFFALRPLLKQTGCRVHVKSRHGLPFFLDKLEKRKFFAVGFLLFIAGLFIFSSLVWQVKVEGNQRIPTEDIIGKAAQLGIFPHQWKFRIGDTDKIADEMTAELPGMSWIGIRIEGTKVLIKVVESDIPEKRELYSPRNLVSTSDAVVTDMFVERGRPVVQPNMRVKKGQVLVSGWIGDEANKQAVVAKGTVRGLVWHEYNITVPEVLKRRVYTGETQLRNYLVIGNLAIRISGFGKSDFQKFETIPERNDWHLGSLRLPFGWLHEKLMEVNYEVTRLGRKEAETLGLEQGRADIRLKSGGDGQVKNEKILHEKIEGGKVYMKVLFEVDQKIAIEQPIVQGE